MTTCTAKSCSRPAQGNTRTPVPQVSDDARAVTVPVHECRQCWEHCEIRAHVLRSAS